MALFRNREVEKRQSNFGMIGQPVYDPNFIPPFPGYGAMSAAGVTVNESTVKQLEVVNTALDIIVSGITQRGNLRAYEMEMTHSGSEYRQWLPDQPPILDQLFQFSGPMTNSQTRGMDQVVRSMALFNESWLYIIKDPSGAALGVEVLHPLMLTTKPNPTNSQQVIYEYGVGQNRQQVDPADLAYIPLKSEPGEHRGRSQVSYNGVIFGLALAAFDYSSAWFSQGASPGYILSSTEDVDSEVAERIVQHFVTGHTGGPGNAHYPLYVGNGVNVQQTSVDADSAQMLETMQFVRTCVASLFHIPSHLIGGIADKGNTWGQGTEEIMQQMEIFTYTPYTKRIEEVVSNLLPATVGAAFPTNPVTPSLLNLGQAVQFIRQAQMVSINEGRAMWFGLGPVDGGDQVIMPLASNTSPEQTETPAQQEPGGPNAGSGGDDSSD